MWALKDHRLWYTGPRKCQNKAKIVSAGSFFVRDNSLRVRASPARRLRYASTTTRFSQ
jgi:hypothetical protein